MIVHELSCFQGFRCIASACGDNCCIGWEIDIDEDSLERYRRVSGPLGERLARSIAAGEDGSAHFRLTEGERCPLLRADGLCGLYCQLGEGALCEICRQHPRFHNFYGGFLRESGLGLCCEEAGRLLFSAAEGPTICTSVEGDSGPEAGLEVLEPLLKVRENLLRLLENDALPLWRRLEQLQTYAAAQQRLEEGNLCPTPLLVPLSREGAQREESRACCRRLVERLGEMESINGEWDELLAETLATFDRPDQEEQLAEFHRLAPRLEEDCRRVTVYALFRYFLDDGLDGDFMTPAALCIVFAAVLHRLDFALWLRRGKGAFLLRDQVDAARILSKQLEYSEENMALLREALLIPGALPENLPFFLLGELREV